MLATLRGIAAMLGLITFSNNRSELEAFADVGPLLLLVYAATAIGIVIYLYGIVAVPRRLPLTLHAADVAVAAALALSRSQDTATLVLLFPLLAAAFRWTFHEVVLTAVVVGGLIVTQTFPVTSVMERFASDPRLTSRVQVRAVSIMVLAIMIGYLAHGEDQRRREVIDIGTVLRTARLSGEFDQTLGLVLGSIVSMFNAASVVLTLSDRRTGRTFLWRTDASDAGPHLNTQLEFEKERRRDYAFELPGTVFELRSPVLRASTLRVKMFDRVGTRIVSAKAFHIPDSFRRRHPCRRIVGMRLTFDSRWGGRLLVLDPHRSLGLGNTLRLALRLSRELGPSTYGLYRIHHLRTRAQDVERSRLSRELHDGVTQSLLGVEMMIAVLRRRALQEAPALDPDLCRIHELIREDIIALREVIESGRVVESTSGDALADLEALVDRFHRYSEIQAKFVSDRRPVALAVHVYSEVVRIVHEGLVNIRKHSGARHVVVRSAVVDEWWSVSLEDDGRGFPFGGLKTQAELDEQREGPRTMIERAKRLGGEVSVESRPGSGARVTIAVRLPVPS